MSTGVARKETELKNLITCLIVALLSNAVLADKAQKVSAYPLEDGQVIANNEANLQRYSSPCGLPPFTSSFPCGNAWGHDWYLSPIIKFIATDNQGMVILFRDDSTNRSVYRFDGEDTEWLFQLLHEPQAQPAILGNSVYYKYHTGESSLYKANLTTGESILIADDTSYGNLASDGVNLFAMTAVIDGNCGSADPWARYHQIWTVNQNTGDLESLVCNWIYSCGSVANNPLFVCSKGYFHVYMSERMYLVDPTPSNDLVQATFYCDENDYLLSLSSRQTSGSYSPDLDCSGDVGVDDLLTLIGKWGGTFGPADLNKDGHVNIHDLLTMISAWD